MTKQLQGEIVKKYMMRGKLVFITRIDNNESSWYAFRVSDRVQKKDYYSNERYETMDLCEKDSVKIVKAV